jgi:hypothetical protein
MTSIKNIRPQSEDARPFSGLIRQLIPCDSLTWLRVRLEWIGRMGVSHGMEVAQRFEEWQ